MKFLVSVIMLALLVSSAYAGKKKSGPLFIYPMPSYETQKQVKNKYVAQMICKTQTVYLRDSSSYYETKALTMKMFMTNLLLTIEGDDNVYIYTLEAEKYDVNDKGIMVYSRLFERLSSSYSKTNPIFNFLFVQFGDEPILVNVGELDRGSYDLQYCNVTDPTKYNK